MKVVTEDRGVALRGGWFHETAETIIPLSIATMESGQDTQQIYLQADAAAHVSKADKTLLPKP